MVSLNTKQSEVMKKVISGDNLYIGGPGGVGKSFLIREIMNGFGGSTVLLAPTGIAALNIGGATVHSVFKLPLGILTKSDHNNVSQKVHDLFDKNGPVKRIVIDEISMVRQDVFKAIDIQLRKARRLNIPFGGLQVIVVGDFYQLPPVVTNNEKKYFFKEYDSQFAFGGETWSQGSFNYFELDEIMRQTDGVFIGHLQRIRQRAPGFEESVRFFNNWAIPNTEAVLEEDPVFLCTINRVADQINQENYNSLDEKEYMFRGEVEGKFGNNKPSPENLGLKFGTKVLFTANDVNGQFKNGETGYVTGFVGKSVKVLKESNEQEILVDKHTWEERDYAVNGGSLISFPVGKYKQYPLKHGWAVTIHKSQGMSLDNAVIQMGRGAFASGQTYVALSRLRTLEGMGLIGNILPSDVIVDPAISDFYKNGCRGIGLGI